MEIGLELINTLNRAQNESFWEGFDEVEPVYDKIFEVQDVDKDLKGVDYGQMTTLIQDGDPRQIAPGQDHNFDRMGEAWTAFWATRVFQQGFQIEQSEIDNASHNPKQVVYDAKTRAKKVGARMAKWRDQFCARAFMRGAITAGDRLYFDGTRAGHQFDPYPGLIYDNNPWFDTAHPLYLAAGTTYSNFNASNSFSQANLRAALIQFQATNAYDEFGRRVALKADTLIVPPNLEYDVEVVLGSDMLPGSANNDKNPMKGKLKPLVWAELTDTDCWAICSARMGAKFIKRGEPWSSYEITKFKGKGVLSFSWIDEFCIVIDQWRYWLANNLPTS